MVLQFLCKCLKSFATFAIVLSWYAFRFIQSIVLTMFILDWDAVLSTGDDVAVPALGQSILLFLVFLFLHSFFISPKCFHIFDCLVCVFRFLLRYFFLRHLSSFLVGIDMRPFSGRAPVPRG